MSNQGTGRQPRKARTWRCGAGSLLCAVAAASGAGPAAAAGTDSSQRVNVTGSAAQERRDEVAGRQVISSEELARHGDTRLTDALRRVPGIGVSGSGADLQIRLDGMAAEQTLLLLNGEPVPRGQALEALAIGMVERIEIVRGAQVQWSGRGLAGTINIVTTRTPRSAQRNASLALGSYFGRATAQGELNLGDKVGPHSWRLGLVARADRERYPVDQRLQFSDTAGQVRSAYRTQTIENARDEAITLTPQLQWARPDGAQLQLESVLSVSQFVGAGDDLRSEAQGDLPRLQADRLAYRHQRGFLRLRVAGSLPLVEGTTLSASVTGSRGRRVQDSRLTGVDFDGRDARDSTVDSTRTDDLLSARAELQHRLGAAHTLSAGVQLEGNRRQEDRVQREIIPSWVPDLVDERYDAASQSRAVFVQDDWLASAQTTLSLGARLEHLDTRSEGNVFDGVRRRYQLSSPMLNLLWRPDKTAQWKLGLSRAFRLPEPRDLMPRRWTRPENSSLVPDFMGNAELQPEAAWTLTGGWEQRLGSEGASSLGLNLVLKRVDDVILDELVLLDGQYVLRRGNFGRAWVGSLQGRWQGEAQAPWGGAVKLSVDAAARASRLSALPGPDNRLPEQAPWSLRLDVEHQPAGSRWTWTAAWQHSASIRAQAPSGRVLGRGGAQGLDLSATWQQDPASRWRVSVAGLAARDTVETIDRHWAGGLDRYHARTEQAPRWRVQWMHRF